MIKDCNFPSSKIVVKPCLIRMPLYKVRGQSSCWRRSREHVEKRVGTS